MREIRLIDMVVVSNERIASSKRTGRSGSPASSSVENINTESLLLRVKDGDSVAVKILFDRYYFQVIGFIRRFVDESDVEDVAQEVFMSVFQRMNKIQNPSAFEGYLFRSAKNRSVNWLRKKHRLRELVQLVIYAANTWKENTGSNETARLDAVNNLIESLPAETRRYIDLFYLRKQSRAEIASQLNQSPSTVYRRIAEARAALLEHARSNNIQISFDGRHGLTLNGIEA